MFKKALSQLGTQREYGPVSIAIGFVLAMAAWDVAKAIVGGMLGYFLNQLNVSNATGSLQFELGVIFVSVLAAVVALVGLLLLKEAAPAPRTPTQHFPQ